MTVDKKLKYYAKKLNQDAPEGEFLAYINKKESNLLKRKGGLGIKTRSGIPSYIGSDASGQGGGSTGGGPGDASDSGRSGSSNSGNKGGKSKGPTARDKQMGALGKTGKEDKSLSSGGSGVDRSKVSQFSTYGRNKFNQNLSPPSTNKFGGILGGILGLLTGIPGLGLITGLPGLLGTKFETLTGKVRGINPITGKPNTQKEYEQMMADKRTQSRIDKMQDRITRGYNQIGFGNFTKTTGPITSNQRATLEDLLSQTDRFGNRFSPSTAQNVLTGRDLNLRGTLNQPAGIATLQQLTQPNINAFPGMGVAPSPMQQQFFENVPYQEPDLYSNAMAGLTKMQQKMLAGPQRNLKNVMGITDQEILDNISPFNDPDDPATLEEVQGFYRT